MNAFIAEIAILFQQTQNQKQPKVQVSLKVYRSQATFRIPLKSQPTKAENSAIKLASLLWHSQRVMLFPVSEKVPGKMFFRHNFLQGIPLSVVKNAG